MKYIILILSFLSLPVMSALYTYDQSGRVIGITYSDGKEIGYQYDASGNIASVETVAQVDTTQPTTPTEPETPTTPETPTNPSASDSGGGGGGSFSVSVLVLLLLSLFPLVIRRIRKHIYANQ